MAKKKEETDIVEEKERLLKSAVEQIQKSFGDGAIMKLGENQRMNISSISTGSLNLDLALGIGGVPRGRIVEIYGAESSGKTTLALNIIAQAQKEGGIAAFIDAEHALDPVYAKALGVNIDDLLISQPDTGEQAMEIVELLVRSSAIDVIVIDSVAALVPKSEIDGEMGDQQMGLQARLMSKALRKLTGSIGKSETVVVFINQIREKIGGFSFVPGVQTTTSGGRALKFFSTIRMEVKKVGQIKQSDDVVGNEVLVKVTKNKVAPPFKEARFNIMYGTGISKEGEILDLAIELQICKKSGAWFSYGDTRLGQGRDKVKMLLEENEELAKEIEEKVLANIDHLRETKKMKKGAKVPEITPNISSPAEKKTAKKEPAKKAPAKADAKLDILVED